MIFIVLALDEPFDGLDGHARAEMTALLRTAGFGEVAVYPAWDGLPVYDAKEWLVYVAER